MRLIITIPLLLLLAGCADLGYYWHSANGHLDLMSQREDIEDLLEDETLDDRLRERLVLVTEIRQFSVERLDLPDNGSYASYVALDQPYVLQNLFAAPEFSTELQQWCYPIVGCASYRGYYEQSRLDDFVAELEAEGLEIYVGQVPAYSTLGWFDDPVLSSFIDWPDYRLAGLLFHELTHQQVFIDGDTTFNESLASAVEQVGTGLWLESQGREADLASFTRWITYRDEVIRLVVDTRGELDLVYASDIDDIGKRDAKQAALQLAREAHSAIAARHGIKAGFTAWFENNLNNAKIGSIAAYNERVVSFVNMLEARDLDFADFFAYVERVAELDQASRDACLDAWESNPGVTGNACPVG